MLKKSFSMVLDDSKLSVGNGGSQIAESTYTSGEGYVKVYVCVRLGGGVEF